MSDRSQDYIKLCEYIKENVKCVDIAKNAGCNIVCVSKARQEYTLKEHDSVRINDEKNVWYRHSQSVGGSCIDMYMWLNECDFRKAVSDIRKIYLADNANIFPEKIERKIENASFSSLKLPPMYKGKCNRVFAYLHKTRKISPCVISYFLRKRRLYEDSQRHNCIFVSYYDKQCTQPAFCFKRGTLYNSTYKGIEQGSDFGVGFTIDNNSDTLFVCEGIIDIMSIMSFFDIKKMSFQTSDYIALCGLSSISLHSYLAQSENRIKKIYICLDNDEKGQARARSIVSELDEAKYDIRYVIPTHKDLNEDLQYHYKNNKEEKS